MSDQKRFRITLWAIDQTAGTSGGWRGDQKAVVFDASAIGVEENANDVGSAFWTLRNDHPQIAEFVPLARHYEIDRWSDDRSRWEFVGAGILNDYSVTEWETTFQGIDYKAVLNQIYTPLSGMTTDNASTLNSDIDSAPVEQVYSSVFLSSSQSASTSTTRFINTNAILLSGPIIEAHAGVVRQIDASEYTALYDQTLDGEGLFRNVNWPGTADESITYWTTPEIRLQWTATWDSTTTSGMTKSMKFRVYVSPPASRGIGEPPIDGTGLIGEFADSSLLGPSGPVISGSVWGDYRFKFYPQELKIAIESLTDPAGLSPTGNAYFEGSTVIGQTYASADDTIQRIAALRPGVNYSFGIFAAIYRSSNDVWFRSYGSYNGSADPASIKYGEPFSVTLGQGTNNANKLITDIFNESAVKSDENYSRLRYASLTVVNSTSTATTHTSYTAGQPSLSYIGDICDMEMGAKTNGSKVVFGIKKPTGGATYDGDFQLNLSVSSAASTAIALRYPENIRSFSFTPGYSRVRNDIKVIPTTPYLSGSSGQNTDGTNLIGATAVDQSSISSNGRITLLATKDNLLNSSAAQNEANRLLNTYKVANSKQVSIRAVLDGIDLWNGWDVGDSVRVTINQGLASVDEPFVIAGVRWFGESDGHERVELDLVQGSAFAAAYTAPPTTTAA